MYYLDKYIQNAITTTQYKKYQWDIINYFFILELSSLEYISSLKHIPNCTALGQEPNSHIYVLASILISKVIYYKYPLYFLKISI